jgi:hypothetical protein
MMGAHRTTEGNKMAAKLKTRKEANGTYSWKLVTSDYPGVWERTEARSPWGARVQGTPYLKNELDAEEWMRKEQAKHKPGRRGYSMIGQSEEN